MRRVPDLPYVSCCNFVCTSGHKLHRVPYDTFISCCLASEKLPTTACVVAVGGTRVRLMNQRITAQIPDEVLERHKMSRSFVSGWAGWLYMIGRAFQVRSGVSVININNIWVLLKRFNFWSVRLQRLHIYTVDNLIMIYVCGPPIWWHDGIKSQRMTNYPTCYHSRSSHPLVQVSLTY